MIREEERRLTILSIYPTLVKEFCESVGAEQELYHIATLPAASEKEMSEQRYLEEAFYEENVICGTTSCGADAQWYESHYDVLGDTAPSGLGWMVRVDWDRYFLDADTHGTDYAYIVLLNGMISCVRGWKEDWDSYVEQRRAEQKAEHDAEEAVQRQKRSEAARKAVETRARRQAEAYEAMLDERMTETASIDADEAADAYDSWLYRDADADEE